MSNTSSATATGVCNFLMAQSNVGIGGIPADMTRKLGNWVGGRYQLSADDFTFSMNSLNKVFQKDTSAIIIPRSAIRRATKGKMMMFFATVDLETDMGKFRIRSTPKGTRDLLVALGAT